MIGSPLLLTGGDYEISRSVRLRSSASAYFNRTPGSSSNRQIWTYSAWVKYSVADNSAFNAPILWASGAGGATGIAFAQSSNTPHRVYVYNAGSNIETTQVLRDPSAWYHLVAVVDNTQATASNRTKLYINGVLVTALTTANYPAQNANGSINEATEHNIGRQVGLSRYFDGYLTEINFIDGQALTPSAFGETDAITGVWKPKKYTGTYGTNGFYLNFSDNSNNTATTIGKDYSGNGNNWTPNNISLTSGATYDSMLDVPTPWADGGNGRGNYAVLNPLFRGVNTPGTMQAANLELSAPNNTFWYNGVGTTFVSTGKWYAEFTPLSGTTSSVMVGVANDAYRANDFPGGTGSNGYSYVSNSGNKFFNNTGAGTAYGASFTTGDVIGVGLDLDAGSLTFYKNGVSQGTAFTGIAAGNWTFAVASAAASVIAANFGQRPFAYTPPSGFKALHTGNLPEPTIKKGGSFFNTVLYTGDGTTNGSKAVTGVGFQPDFIWLKSRNNTYWNVLQNSVVGITSSLFSNTTNAEANDSYVTQTTADGFNVSAVTGGSSNNNGTTYVAWNWKEGATQGFDIVTYTGNGANANISHGLGVAPSMIIRKARNASAQNNWYVYHQSLSANGAVFLNLTDAYFASSSYWNNTAPTSTVFTVGAATNVLNDTWVAYLFAEVAGFSKFGSYTGNGSTDGPFVFCGFRPRFVMIKRSDNTSNWIILDTARNTFNVMNSTLWSDLSSAEGTFTIIDSLSNGFKLRENTNGFNASGGTYIFAAFAENPFKYSLAR